MEPRIGLALGSGSARGLSHIGVIEVLEEEGIPIHCVAGNVKLWSDKPGLPKKSAPMVGVRESEFV